MNLQYFQTLITFSAISRFFDIPRNVHIHIELSNEPDINFFKGIF